MPCMTSIAVYPAIIDPKPDKLSPTQRRELIIARTAALTRALGTILPEAPE